MSDPYFGFLTVQILTPQSNHAAVRGHLKPFIFKGEDLFDLRVDMVVGTTGPTYEKSTVQT